MQEIHPFGGGAVMVGAAIFYGGTMNAVTYRTNIINSIVHNYWDNLETAFIFSDDTLIKNCLKSN